MWTTVTLQVSNLTNTPILATFFAYNSHHAVQKYFLLFFKNSVCFSCGQSCRLLWSQILTAGCVQLCIPHTAHRGLVSDKLMCISTTQAIFRLEKKKKARSWLKIFQNWFWSSIRVLWPLSRLPFEKKSQLVLSYLFCLGGKKKKKKNQESAIRLWKGKHICIYTGFISVLDRSFLG